MSSGYCPTCRQHTTVRFLDCAEHGWECQQMVCVECGADAYVVGDLDEVYSLTPAGEALVTEKGG